MAKLLFTNTDSLCYNIKTEDVYRDMLEEIDYYDTSNYPPDHFLYRKQNEKVIGKFKDETKSVLPLEFCGLRSKMYSLNCGKITKMTAKGIKKSYIKHHLKHPTFIKALRGVGRIQDIQIDKSRRKNRDDKDNRTVAVRHETIHFTGRYIDASVRTLQNRRLRITMIDVVTF